MKKGWTVVVVCVLFIGLLGAADACLAQSTPSDADLQPFTVNFVYRSGGKGEVKTLTKGADVYSGDYYKVILTPAEDCYIYIFQIDSAQKTQRIFPMEQYRDKILNNVNPVQANRIYYIPTQNDWFRLDQQTGVERIFLWATRQRDEQLEQLVERTKKADSDNVTMELMAYAEQVLASQPGTARGFDDIVESEPFTWQEDGESVAFSIVQQRLEELCDGCFYLLTFMHN